MWLTPRELASELHLNKDSISRLRQRRKLTYINVGSAKLPRYRYQIPTPTSADSGIPIDRVALLTYAEVGEILGLSYTAVRKLVNRGKIKPARSVGNRKMITIEELRRVLAIRDKRKGQMKKSYSPILMKWLQAYLEKRETPVQVLDLLIKEAAAVTSDRRSGYITQLWNGFDAVQAILREIEQERTRPTDYTLETNP